ERSRGDDALAVDEGAVGRAGIVDLTPAVDRSHERVAVGDLRVVDRDVRALTADRQLAPDVEATAREGAGLDDQHGSRFARRPRFDLADCLPHADEIAVPEPSRDDDAAADD